MSHACQGEPLPPLEKVKLAVRESQARCPNHEFETTAAQARFVWVTPTHPFLLFLVRVGVMIIQNLLSMSLLCLETHSNHILFQIKTVHRFLNLGEVWIIRRDILDKSTLFKSFWISLICLGRRFDTNGHGKEEKNKEFCGKGRNLQKLAKFPVSQDSHCLAW